MEPFDAGAPGVVLGGDLDPLRAELAGVEAAALGGGVEEVDNVGNPINTSTFRTRLFHPLMKAAGVPTIRFQDIRGTTATLLAFLGVDEAIIQKLLGHAAVQTTRRHYIHLLDDPRVREALERLQTTLAAAPATAAGGR